MDFASTFKILARPTPMEKLQDSLRKLAQKYPAITLCTPSLNETTNKITIRVIVPEVVHGLDRGLHTRSFQDTVYRDHHITLCNSRRSVGQITEKVDDLAIEYGVEAKPVAGWFARLRPTLAVPSTH